MQLSTFDANCRLNRHLKLRSGEPHTAEDLLGEMDHFGISESLVVDSLSRENHPDDGNHRIIETTRGHPRLHPAWSVVPTGPPDEQPEPEELVRSMRENKVGAIFLYPRQYRFGLSDWEVDAFLKPLSEVGVPVFVDYGEIGGIEPPWDETDWGEVVGLCRRLPDLELIVGEKRFRRSNRTIYRALDACESLHIEISGYWLHKGIEYITRNWGSGRLVFGSNWPRWGQGCTLASLMCADIDREDKERIAGGNLRELLSWCGLVHPEVALPPPADEYIAMGSGMKPPGEMRFMDCHGHLGGRASHYHLPYSSLEDTVSEMDRMGIEKACVFSFTVVFGDERFGNDLVAEAVGRYPDRFIGFTGLNPHRGGPGMIEELERCRGLGLRGIKLIPHYQGFPPEDPVIEVPCRWAHENEQIILNHHWGSPGQVERLVKTYDRACFMTGHATTEYADIMRRYPNLYVCSCAVPGPRECEEVVRRVGADRFVFGSDLQDLPISWGLGPILFARLSTEEKRMILRDNLERILRLYSLPQ